MASVATPPPAQDAIHRPSAAMQNVGAAQQPGMSNQQMGAASMDSLVKAVDELFQKTKEAASIANAVHPPLLAYFTKMAEVGSAIQQEVKNLAQQAQQGGAQQPAQGAAAPSPTDGPGPTA